MLDVRIVEDCAMPSGHDWFRVTFPGGRVVTFVSVSLVLNRGAEQARTILQLAEAS